MNKYLNLKELNVILYRLSKAALYTYLDNYRFNPYRKIIKHNGHRKLVYLFNNDFLDVLEEFFTIKKCWKGLRCLEEYRRNNG